MGARATVGIRSQLALESTAGTKVPATKRLPNIALIAGEASQTKQYRGQGFKYPSSEVLGKEWTAFTYDGAGSYDELAYIFSSLFSLTVPTSLGSGAYQWAILNQLSTADVPATYTVEHGDATASANWNFGYGLVDAATLTINRDEFKCAGTGIGQQFTTGITMTTTNAVQSLVDTGASAGTFTLTFNGAATAAIAYNASAATVQTALVALPTIGAGNVLCAGGALPSAVSITFQGALAGQVLPLITANSGGLTGGTAVVTQSTAGAPTIINNAPIQPHQVSVFLDTTFAGIGTTQLLGDYSVELQVGSRWVSTWPLNNSLTSFNGAVEAVPKATMKISIDADTVSDAFITQFRAGSTKYLQVLATGAAIGGGNNYKFQLQVPFQVAKGAPFKDMGGVWVADWEITPVADATANYAMNVVLINKTSAL